MEHLARELHTLPLSSYVCHLNALVKDISRSSSLSLERYLRENSSFPISEVHCEPVCKDVRRLDGPCPSVDPPSVELMRPVSSLRETSSFPSSHSLSAKGMREENLSPSSCSRAHEGRVPSPARKHTLFIESPLRTCGSRVSRLSSEGGALLLCLVVPSSIEMSLFFQKTKKKICCSLAITHFLFFFCPCVLYCFLCVFLCNVEDSVVEGVILGQQSKHRYAVFFFFCFFFFVLDYYGPVVGSIVA